jgi:tRNA(Phe) wybutosine-synthesizing methylase Tyw3
MSGLRCGERTEEDEKGGDANVSRWLTKEEKQAELEFLEELYPTANQNCDGLDNLWVPFLKRINKLTGTVTLQSCQGHEEQEELRTLSFETLTVFLEEVSC